MTSSSCALRCVSMSRILLPHVWFLFFFFFNDTATTEIYTLSLHDALPIYHKLPDSGRGVIHWHRLRDQIGRATSELQSPCNLVCRLLLEKKNNTNIKT